MTVRHGPQEREAVTTHAALIRNFPMQMPADAAIT